jgi:hypothetical protein
MHISKLTLLLAIGVPKLEAWVLDTFCWYLQRPLSPPIMVIARNTVPPKFLNNGSAIGSYFTSVD